LPGVTVAKSIGEVTLRVMDEPTVAVRLTVAVLELVAAKLIPAKAAIRPRVNKLLLSILMFPFVAIRDCVSFVGGVFEVLTLLEN
jgi:hypothetical protein